MGRYSERFTRDILYTLLPFLRFRKENQFIRIHCNRNLFLFFLDCTTIIDNDIVRRREREARGMNGKMERTAPAKRETVVVEGETTPKKERENNGEFNMAPRGSFNHLIESPAYLGSPPRRLHLASSLSSSRIPPSKGRRLLKDEFAHILFLSPPLFLFAFRWAVANPLSSAPQYPVVSETHRVWVGIRVGSSPAIAQMVILDSNIQIQRLWLSLFECRANTRFYRVAGRG